MPDRDHTLASTVTKELERAERYTALGVRVIALVVDALKEVSAQMGWP